MLASPHENQGPESAWYFAVASWLGQACQLLAFLTSWYHCVVFEWPANQWKNSQINKNIF